MTTWDKWRAIEESLREAQEAITQALAHAEAGRIDAAEREALTPREVALREIEAGR